MTWKIRYDVSHSGVHNGVWQHFLIPVLPWQPGDWTSSFSLDFVTLLWDDLREVRGLPRLVPMWRMDSWWVWILDLYGWPVFTDCRGDDGQTYTPGSKLLHNIKFISVIKNFGTSSTYIDLPREKIKLVSQKPGHFCHDEKLLQICAVGYGGTWVSLAFARFFQFSDMLCLHPSCLSYYLVLMYHFVLSENVSWQPI